ncbi:hypothetical protein [Rhodococcus koreensis]|uniref:hypothetical protein n=1 Tax=Rhodococcus koreensis TaxID=99653 RepID=UPI0036DC269A
MVADTGHLMEKPHRDNPEDRRGQLSDDPADPVAVFGEQADDFIARAIMDALAEGMSWAQIGARLGVPPPAPDHDDEVSDRDWQEAIVAHENARAARRRYDDRHRTDGPESTP